MMILYHKAIKFSRAFAFFLVEKKHDEVIDTRKKQNHTADRDHEKAKGSRINAIDKTNANAQQYRDDKGNQ